MQTYEKCVDYIQTHFMLLREEMLRNFASAKWFICKKQKNYTVKVSKEPAKGTVQEYISI